MWRSASALRLEPCELPGTSEPARCGSLEVYENRAARSGRRIPVRVAVFPAKSTTPAPDPLFILAGGPGQSAVEFAVREGRIDHQQAGRFVKFYEEALNGYTYLEGPGE